MYKKCLLVIGALLLAGCANPYKQFYTDNTGGMDFFKNGYAILPSNGPQLMRGGNQDEDAQKMMEDNYVLLGYSSFFGREFKESLAIAQGKEIHADVVLLYMNFKDTQSGNMPLVLPDTQTSTTQGTGVVGMTPYSGSFTTTTYGSRTMYMPFNVNRYDYLAWYWVKRRVPLLGIIPRDLTAEERKKIGTNKGIFIAVTVKNSPAYKADVFKGDIIIKIDDEDVLGAKEFLEFIKEKAGKKVVLTIVRDGNQLTKEIQLSSL